MKREFTYEANFADNFHGVLLGLWGTRAKTVRSGLTCLMFGIFGAVVLRVMGLPPNQFLPMALVLAVGWGTFITAVLGGQQALLLTRRQRAIGPARIAITVDGLERTTRSATVQQNWDGIAYIDETSRAFFMYDATHPVFAIEKSALRSTDELVALRRFLSARKPGRYLADP